MVKTKRKRFCSSSISNPLGSFGRRKTDDSLIGSDHAGSGPIDAIRDQLQNSNLEEKLNGLQSLAVLSADKNRVVNICSSEIIRIASPLLVERDNAVRNAAAGALRNLSVCGSEVCEHLVDQDVLTPLISLLSEYSNDYTWTPCFDASRNGQLDLKSDIFLQAINFLWNLCESSSKALDVFNQSQILEKIIRCLDYSTFGMDISTSVAQCLLVISENNPKSWVVINNKIAVFLTLLHLDGGYQFDYFSSLIAGILSNVPALSVAHMSKILNRLSQILGTDHVKELGKTFECVTNTEERCKHFSDLEENMETEECDLEEKESINQRVQELQTETEIAMKNLECLLDAQRLAAEIINNMCSPDDEDPKDDDDYSGNEYIIDNDTMGDSDHENLKNSDNLSIDVLEILKLLGLSEKLWQRSQPLKSEIAQIIREANPGILKKIKNLRISTLICLQNMCNAMRLEDLGGPTNVYAMWVELGQQVFKGPQEAIILEPSTSLMRSALDHLKKNRELFDQMTGSDLELILDGVNRCSVAEIRANWLRMLGTLGCLLPEHLVKIIISFILETCSKEEDVWTFSEAIDALMDIFADNDWPQIISDLNLCEKIQNLEKVFKSKIRQQRKELNERCPAVYTVRSNLSRFVIYIENVSLN